MDFCFDDSAVHDPSFVSDRVRSDFDLHTNRGLEKFLKNVGGDIIQENLDRVNMTESDLFGKLREANALNSGQVKAVVFETTGDVSVLHTDDDSVKLEERFFTDVIGVDRLFR